MKYKIITPAELPNYKGEPVYVDMEMYLGKTTMITPNVMQSMLPSCLVFYDAEDAPLQAIAVSVSSHTDGMLSLDELVEMAKDDDFYVVYKNRMPSATFNARNSPVPDPSKCYRYKKVQKYIS